MTKLDDLLSKWPSAEGPAQAQFEADETAERVTAAIQAGQAPAAIDESLLSAPLPKTDDEGQTSPARVSKPGAARPGLAVENKMSKDRTRDRTSFQELAKLAQTTPPPPSASSGPHTAPPPNASSSGPTGVVRGEEAQSSDSGIVDLKAIASADPSGSQRAQTTPLASSGLFEDESAPPKPAISEAVAASVAPAPVSHAPAAAPAVASTAPKAAPAEEKKKGGGLVLVLGSLVAAAAIAAGGFFFVKNQHKHDAVAQSTQASAPDKLPEKSTTKAGTAPAATGAASLARADEIDTTPDNNGNTGGGAAKPGFRFHAKQPGAGGAAVASAAPEATAAGGVDPKLIANIPTGGAGGGSGDLSEAMKAAAGGGTGLGQGGGGDGQKFAPGNVPPRPSQGQITGAVGGVMPTVRACLGSDEPVSRATVTLQSDGTVKSVSVTGFAAGKPEEACIKAALQTIKVDPFAEASYPIPVTIRPN